MVQLQYAAAVVALVAAAALAGLPLVAAFGVRLDEDVQAALAPMFGVATASIFGWYWSSTVGGPLAGPLLAFVATMAVVGVGLLVAQRDHLAALARSATRAAALVAVDVAVLTAIFLPLVPLGRFTSVSLGNNDVASYALVTDSLLRDGVDGEDHVEAIDLGDVAQGDVFGAYTFLGVGASILQQPAWKITWVAMGAAHVLCVLALTSLGRVVFGAARLPSAVVAIAACSTYLFLYMAGQYFLAQLIGIAAVTLLVVVLAASGAAPAAILPALGASAALLVSLVMCYPHMALVGAPGWSLPPLAAASRWGLRGMTRVVATGVGAAVVAAAVISERLIASIKRTLELGDNVQGFNIPTIAPSQVFGFQRQLAYPWSTATIAASVAIGLVAVLAFWAAARRRDHSAFAAAAIVLVAFGVYGVLIVTAGREAYTAAKWLAFFQPMVFVSVVCLALAAIAGHRWAGLRSVSALGGACVAAIAMNGHTAVEPVYRQVGSVLSVELAAINESKDVRALDEVNVDLPSFWETLWSVYFLRERFVSPVSAYYYPMAPPQTDAWTLRRLDAVPQPMPSGTIQLTEHYVLLPPVDVPVAAPGAP